MASVLKPAFECATCGSDACAGPRYIIADVRGHCLPPRVCGQRNSQQQGQQHDLPPHLRVCLFIKVVGVDCQLKNHNTVCSHWPVFPIAVDLGAVNSLTKSVVWVVGLVRDPSISYTIDNQTTNLRPYYTTQYGTTESAVCAMTSPSRFLLMKFSLNSSSLILTTRSAGPRHSTRKYAKKQPKSHPTESSST